MLDSSMVKEPSGFGPLKFYCIQFPYGPFSNCASYELCRLFQEYFKYPQFLKTLLLLMLFVYLLCFIVKLMSLTDKWYISEL